MTEMHPMIHMIQRILGDTQIEYFAGKGAEVEIRMEPGLGYGYNAMQSRIRAVARSREDLVRVIEMYIMELETMRREAMRTEEFDA